MRCFQYRAFFVLVVVSLLSIIIGLTSAETKVKDNQTVELKVENIQRLSGRHRGAARPRPSPRPRPTNPPLWNPLLPMTSTQKKEMLDMHNQLRARVGASSMNRLVWDDHLETKAMGWAFYGEFTWEVLDGIGERDIGQNIYAVRGSVYNVWDVVSSWYNEERFYCYNNDQCAEDEKCDNYLQLMWDDTTSVGCGAYLVDPFLYYGDDQEGWMVVCDYRPKANLQDRPLIDEWGETVRNRPPYKVGIPCTRCSHGYGWCSGNLCSTSCPTEPLATGPCTCQAICDNCGILDTDICKCDCTGEWIGGGCKDRCRDTYWRCASGVRQIGCINTTLPERCPVSCGLCNATDCSAPSRLPEDRRWSRLHYNNCTARQIATPIVPTAFNAASTTTFSGKQMMLFVLFVFVAIITRWR